jgi:hypothetical protein
MSKFLAPIHSWLFNKIKLSESIEKEIILAAGLNQATSDQNFLNHLFESIGPQLGDEAIEDIIDVTNIHGWLQGRIHQTEQRIAALVTYVINHKPSGIDLLKSVYEKQGKALIADYGFNGPLSPDTAFKKIHDVLLEGMPCDRVHQVVAQELDYIRWDSYQCLHETYFNKVDGDIANYYALKQTFVKALLSETSPELTYTFAKAEPGQEALYINVLTQN